MESSDIVCLRDFGIEFVGAVPWGTHLCQFYNSKQDLIDVLVPYFAAGLRDNEFCMWVTSSPLEVSEAKEALKKAVPDLENYLQKGQIEIVSYEDQYLLGGKFDADRALEGWVNKEKAAFKNGFEGLRLSGNTFWVEKGLWRSFVDYEEAVNTVIGQHKMVALCTYCIAKTSGADVLDVIQNHKGTLLKQGENWALIENAIERKREEDALIEREQSWQTTLGSIGDAVMATDMSGKITFMNKVAENLTGWTLGAATEEPLERVFCIVNEKTRREVENPVARVLKEGMVVGLANHTVLIRKDGTEIPIDDSGAPIRGKDGKVTGVVLVFRDISERKKAEKELYNLAKFPSENPDAVLRVNHDGIVIYANSGSQRLPKPLSVQEGRIVRPLWLDYLTEALSSNSRLDFEESTEGRWFLFKVAPIPQEGYVNIYGLEITERKKAELALKQSLVNEHFLAELVRNASVAVGVGYPDGRLGMVNEAFVKLTGYSQEELQKTTWNTTLTPPEYWEFEKSKLAEINSIKKPIRYEKEYVRKDGSRVAVELVVHPFFDEKGQVTHYFSFITDITERKKAEEEVKELHERLLLQVNRMPIGLIVWDSEFRAITWNPAAARIFGFTEQEALGKHPYGLIVPKEAQPIVDEIWSRLLKGDESANSVNENITKSGRTIVCNWANTPLKKDDGTVIGVLSMVQDITERKKAEEALSQSEERLRLKLDNLLSPETELEEQDLQNILDVSSLQAMMDNLYEVTKMGIAIIDLKGNVLVATGWQDICTRFHRVNPETCRNCVESDLHLTEEVKPGEIRLYKCKNNMWDAVTPLVIGKKHVGNVFFGQFFFEGEVVDRSVFAEQAEKYGFDKEQYMAAFERIPRFSRERVENLLKFYAKMAGLTSKLSFGNLELAKSLSIQKDMRLKLEDYAKNLESLVKERTDRLESSLLYSRTLIEASLDPLVTISAEGKITDVNKATEETTGCSREQLIGSDFSDYFTEPEKAREGYKQAFTKGYVKDYPLAIKSRAGKITEVVYNATVYRNESGAIQGVLAAARDVTERRKAEAAVQAERKRFFDVLETLPTMVCLLTPDYHIIFANKSFREKFGESHGRHCYDYCFGKQEPCSFCESYEVLETGKPHQWEVKGPDGSVIEAYDFPFNDIDGSPLILEMDIDVTQRKRAEEAVQNERKRLFDVLETIPAMVCLITPDYHIAFANRSFKERFGESHGRTCFDYCFGQTEPCKFCESLIPLKTGEPHHWEVKGPDGSVIEANDYPFSDIDGSPLVLEMDIDVTRQRKTEEQLRTASQYARSLLEASLDPLVTISADGKITDVNQATEEATGRSRLELIGCDFSDFFTEPEEARKGYQKVFVDGVVRDYPLAIRHVSGKVMDVLYNATLYANEEGKVQGVFAAARDVTERKKAEAALARQAQLIDLTPDAIVVMGPHEDARFWSRGAERLYGWQRSEVIGKQIHELLKTTFPEPLENIMNSLKETGFWSGELLQRSKDGKAIVVQSRWIPKIDESGRVTEVLKSNVDITQRKAMENEITQTSERLRQSNAELEQFAYVASHDLQEPLRMVASYVQLLQKRYQGKLDADADEFIGYAVDGANRMRGLIDDLLIYSRVGRLGKPFERTNVESTLNIALKNLEASIAENKATVTHDKLPVVNADAGQLVQLFQNLVGNAIKFHGNEPPKVHVSARDKGSEFEFEVADNGIGIDPQYFDRLFKIFQRLHTREEYPGSGIGLAVCKKIVERHGGRIWIESESGKGSTIHFTLSKRKE